MWHFWQKFHFFFFWCDSKLLVGPGPPHLGRTYCGTFLFEHSVAVDFIQQLICKCCFVDLNTLSGIALNFKLTVLTRINKPRLLNYCRLKCFYLRTCSYFTIRRGKDYLLFPNLTVYCLFTAANRSVFWWHLFSLGPFQPVVSLVGNRITYCKNFGEKTCWTAVKIITLNWRELLFVKINFGCCDELAW